MRNEVLGLDYDEMSDDENSVVGYWNCPCGERYEITSYSNVELRDADEFAEEERLIDSL